MSKGSKNTRRKVLQRRKCRNERPLVCTSNGNLLSMDKKAAQTNKVEKRKLSRKIA